MRIKKTFDSGALIDDNLRKIISSFKQFKHRDFFIFIKIKILVSIYLLVQEKLMFILLNQEIKSPNQRPKKKKTTFKIHRFNIQIEQYLTLFQAQIL